MSEVNPVSPRIEHKDARPTGVLPRHIQTWILTGLAAVMIGVMWLSPSHPPDSKKTALAQPSLAVIDPNQARIQEYRTRLDEEMRKLSAEQAQVSQMKQVLGAPAGSGTEEGNTLPQYGRVSPPRSFVPYDRSEQLEQQNALRADREKREYLSRFASNFVDFRPTTTPAQKAADTGRASGSSHDPTSVADHGGAKSPVAASSNDPYAELNRAEGKNYRLFEGTILETVLTNRLDGSFSGPVNCMVTTPVYSHDGKKLLVPEGTRVLGEVQKLDTFGQQRLAVMFHRMIMPDGYSVSLDQFKGLNQIGETGLRDRVNHHYAQIFGVSLAIGSIAGLAQSTTRYGLDVSGADAYRQGVASSLSQSSLRILDRYLNVLPTFTIREGHRIKVYLADDLMVPAYENHRMPSDL